MTSGIAVTAEPQAPIVVAMQSRRRERALLAQKLQHLIPALPLLFQGAAALASGVAGFGWWLAVGELVTSVLLFVTVIRTILHYRADAAPHGAHGVDWAHVWAAGVLLAEAGERWHLHHHLARPIILTAIVTLALGLFHGRIAARTGHRRSLRVDDSGVALGKRPFGMFRAAWGDLDGIDFAGRDAVIRTRGGAVRRINLADVRNEADVRRALDHARARLREFREARTSADG